MGRKRLTHHEYIQRLKDKGSLVYPAEGVQYDGYNTKIPHTCPSCKEAWDVIPADILKGSITKTCLSCKNGLVESVMATTLKQHLKYKYPKTIYEADIGFKGDRGGISRYDILVPELNLVIECQSEFHDTERQKALDERKKQFAISNNYNYLSFDNRTFTPLEVLQYFSPHLKEIPKYISFKKNTIRTWSLQEAQELLNQRRYRYEEIAERLGNDCTAMSIKRAVSRGFLTRPDYFVRKTPIIYQYSLEGEFIQKHYSRSVEGISSSSIGSACRGNYKKNGHRLKGSLWYYENTLPAHLYKDRHQHINSPADVAA